MKVLSFFFIAAALIAGAYFLFFSNEEKIVVDGNLNTTTHNSFDINAPQVTEGFSDSFVEGTAENISDEEITGIIITYKIQGNEVEARIDNIPAKAKVNFKTNTIKTTGSNPPFSLQSVIYEE